MSIGFDRLLPTTPDKFLKLRLWLKGDDIVDGKEPANGTAVNIWRDRGTAGDDPASPGFNSFQYAAR